MHIPEEWGINAGDNWEGMQLKETKSSQPMKQGIKPIIFTHLERGDILIRARPM